MSPGKPPQRRRMPPPKRRGDTCVARTTDATPQDAAAKRRGDTCVARITVATPQLAGNTAYTAARNAADGACRSGTGRHKWRPYVHHRANNRRNGTSKPHVRPVRPPQYRGRTSQNVGATLVSPGRPTQRRNWPASSRTPPRATPRTGCAVPAPGVINGAPTSITARKTVATPQLAGNIAYTAARNAADGACRSGTGRHKWRPYVHHRANNRRNGTSKPHVRPVRPPQYRGRTSQNVGATLVSPGKPTQRRNWPASPRAGPRQMRQRARSKLLVTTDTDEKAMHAADTPGVSISPHTGKSAPAARGMPTAL